MKFGVLGTGMVGRAISAKLLTFEHDVMIGTRDVATLTARSEPDVVGNPPFSPRLLHDSVVDSVLPLLVPKIWDLFQLCQLRR